MEPDPKVTKSEPALQTDAVQPAAKTPIAPEQTAGTDRPAGTTAKADSSMAFFKTLPKTFQIALVAGIGLLMAAIVALVALLLSGGDSRTLNSSNQAADDGSAAAGTTQTQAPETPASTGDGSGKPASGNDKNSSDSGGAASGGSGSGSPAASAVNTNPSAASTITITTDGFSPADMTVAKNTVITWKNADTTDHAIDKGDDKPGPHSPQLKPGATYSYTYTTAGSYRYIDVMKPDKGGTITVKD